MSNAIILGAALGILLGYAWWMVRELLRQLHNDRVCRFWARYRAEVEDFCATSGWRYDPMRDVLIGPDGSIRDCRETIPIDWSDFPGDLK